MNIKCFWMEPTSYIERSLRRYNSQDVCESAKNKYHEALVGLDTVLYSVDNPEHPLDDPRWPTQCTYCSYQFTDNDPRQVSWQRLYIRPDTGAVSTRQAAPPGAMWDATWVPLKGPDGLCLAVMTPGGEWYVDAPSENGTPWTRTGEVPRVSVTPSIQINNRGGPDYHGFLVEGSLVPV